MVPAALLASLVLGAAPAFATARALLVAASVYPQADLRLEGPANDARLLFDVLTSRGFEPGHIRVLADGIEPQSNEPGSIAVAGPPTRQAIVDAFAALAAEAEPGDQVFIAMSGHGAQQPAAADQTEADGWDEVFLPVDVGSWNDGAGSIENALVDDEIGRMLDRIRAKGATVWFVLDSCFSGTGTRAAADSRLRKRSVSPERLGVPAQPPRTVAGAADDGLTSQVAGIAPAQGLVAFFAAQSDEEALELSLPADSPDARPHGLLSYYVAQALARGSARSFLDLAQSVRAGYDEAGMSRGGFPTPMFEGDLRLPLPGVPSADATAGIGRGWAALLLDGGRARVDAGQLHGLREGVELMLRDPGGEPVARGTVDLLGMAASDLTLGWKRDGAIPARLVAEPMSLAAPDPLTVATPPDPPPSLRSALDALRPNLTGAGIELAPEAAQADIQLRAARGAAWLVPRGEGVNEMIARGGAGIPLDQPADQLEAQLDASLRARAATLRLARLGETFAGTRAAQDLEIGLAVLPRAVEPSPADPHPICPDVAKDLVTKAKPIGPEDVPHLRHCDTLFLSLRNAGNHPLDVGVFYVDSLGFAVPYPDYAGTRLAIDAPAVVEPLTVRAWDPVADQPATSGVERLVITGLRRADKDALAFTVDFGEILGLTPGVAGNLPGTAHPFLGLLSPEPSGQTRAAPNGDPRQDAFIATVRWQALPL